MLRRVYTVLFYAALPTIFLRLWWRERGKKKLPTTLLSKSGALDALLSTGIERWHERVGRFEAPKLENPIWVHAVSLGEANVAIPLIRALKQAHPEASFVVTTNTPTGSERIQTQLKDQVFHVYAPYDIPRIVERFLEKIRPSQLILIETEIWPNWFAACAAHRIPITIANGRLSPHSFRGYLRFPRSMKKVLSAITTVAAQSSMDADRFIQIGVSPEKVKTTGNIKFDITIPSSLTEEAQALRAQWGTRPVWIAASTHNGEESLVLEAFTRVKAAIPDALLVLVPRRPEYFESVAALCRQHSPTALHSERPSHTNGISIIVGNTLGELMKLYAASDVAFVGGSLIPIGGHNLLEPAALGIPSLTGPHTFNFVDIHRLLQHAGGTLTVQNPTDLADQVIALLQDSSRRHAMGEAGRAVVAANRGALQKHVEVVSS